MRKNIEQIQKTLLKPFQKKTGKANKPNRHDVWRWPNHPSARLPSQDGGERTDEASRLALVVLLSNMTSAHTLDSLGADVSLAAEASEGLEVLWLEDSIRESWVHAVRPVHAADLTNRTHMWLQSRRSARQTSSMAVVWRRHQTTLGNMQIMSAHLSPCCGGVLVYDLRSPDTINYPSRTTAYRGHPEGSAHRTLV